MRSLLDRIRHAISFELIGLVLVTAIGAWVLQRPAHEIGIAGFVGATIATLWNLIYNFIFDIAMQRARGTTEKTMPMRIVHTVLFELGLLLILVPIIAWYFEMGLLQAFLMDVGFVLFYLFYAYLFNLAYDRIFPLPEWQKASAS